MQTVDGELSRVSSAMQVLASSRLLAARDFAAFYVEAQEVLPAVGATNVVLTEASGQQILNTLRPFGAALPPHGNPKSLQLVFATGKPVISDLFAGPVAGQPIMAVEVPVAEGGKTAYSLAAGILPERFAEILRQQHPPRDWVISIFDSTGTIVARTHSPEQFVGKSGAPPLVQRMSEVAEDVIETPTLEGIRVLAAFSRSPTSGWSIAIGIPEADLVAGLRRSLWLSLVAAAALSVGGTLVAGAISNRIARSIRTLSQPALALASGRQASLPAVDIDEAAEIGEALVHASQLLAQRDADRAKAEAAERRLMVADRVAARFAALLEAAPDAMVLVRRDGIIGFANGHAATIFGYAKSELIGQSIELVIPERFRTAHPAHVAGFFASPKLRQMGTGLALFARRRDGTEIPIEVSLSPIEIDGEPCVLAAARDVTDRKRLEASVEVSRAQLADSARLAALGTMAGGIAHEINNPLAVIHALAKDLAESADRDVLSRQEVALTTREIAQYADRIAKIVKSMRHIARDGAKDPFNEAAVCDIVEQALNICAERFRVHSVALLTMPIDPALRIACREVQIAQVLTNLLQNAFDAALEQPGEKWVRLEVTASDHDIVISVIDCGHGISPQVKARIMEPFFTTKPVGKGTGLGLSLSKQIAEEHGGTLEVDEDAGHTRFSLKLPRPGRRMPSCN